MPKSATRPKARAYQRGPHLFTRVDSRGRPVFYARTPEKPKGVSLQTTDPAVAEQRFRALLADPAAAADVGRAVAPELELSEIAGQYLDEPHGWTKQTLRTTRNRLKAFGKWCAANAVVYASELTDAKVSAWLTARTKDVSRRTLNRDLRAPRRMLMWALERGLCAANPLAARKGVREAKRSKVKYVPDAAEFARAAAALDEVHAGAATAVRALYATGLRIEELRRLTVFDVRAGVVYVRPEAGTVAEAEPTKGYRERGIPVAPEVEALVKRFLAWRAGKGEMGKRVGCSESWLIKKLHAAQVRAKLPLFGLHDLRAAFATEAFDRGVGLKIIQQWMGHADPATTQGYIRPRRSDRSVQAPVPGGLFGPENPEKSRADSVQIPAVKPG